MHSLVALGCFFSSFRLLKVLDLSDAPLEKVPNEIVNLFHLRYLSLRRTKIKELPNSLGRLQNLETLDLGDTSFLYKLPNELFKLKRLCSLKFGNIKGGPVSIDESQEQVGIWSLVNLEVLRDINVKQGGRVTRELERMTKLRRLGIRRLRREDGVDLWCSIKKLSNLRFLDVRDDPLEVLQALPNLVGLTLFQAYDGEEMCFKEGGFQALKNLELSKLERLRLVREEDGALPHLQDLYIYECKMLAKVPLGIECLANLKAFMFCEMSIEFVINLNPNKQGVDYWKVAHFPAIFYLKDGPSYGCLISVQATGKDHGVSENVEFEIKASENTQKVVPVEQEEEDVQHPEALTIDFLRHPKILGITDNGPLIQQPVSLEEASWRRWNGWSIWKWRHVQSKKDGDYLGPAGSGNLPWALFFIESRSEHGLHGRIGSLTLNSDGKLMVNCTGEGAPFAEAISDSEIEVLGDVTLLNDPSKLRNLVLTLDSAGIVTELPLLTVQWKCTCALIPLYAWPFFIINGSGNADRKLSIPQLAGAVWDVCVSLKKTPTTNYTAIGRAITQVAVSVKDVLREMKELKPGSTDPTVKIPNEAAAEEASEPRDIDSSSEGDLGNDLLPEEMKIAHQSVDSLERLLKLCQGIGVQVDELGACLYPPQEVSAMKNAAEKISTVSDEMQAEVRSLEGSSEAFSQACEGLESSVRQLLSELGCSDTTNLIPKMQNLAM
ncbi:hypothetical protein HHK36_020212 [Tetracentron sinense]|uniref:Uncharacterized protein n=1 Tax=Tetracentron sinense TaxID=13715 RepID=A0A834YTN4_TETSI|nr:hypothetical protein HHK36_020212 [Tetracentron sinense]